MSTREREVLSAGAGLAAEVALESGGELGEIQAVKARGYWEQVWRRFRKDKVAIASGIFIVLLFVAAFAGAAIAERQLGHSPNEIFAHTGGGVDDRLIPVGPMTEVQDLEGNKSLFILGGADSLGRDLFLRLLYGARVSLEVAIGATLLSMTIGVRLGATAA